jgi:hypothetical protein
MKLKELLPFNIKILLTENKIEQLKNIALPALDNTVKGKFLDKKEVEELKKEIESNYVDGDVSNFFGRRKDDIRQKAFNYDNPIAQKNINGVDLRIAEGLLRNNKKTYLLYADGEIIGEFYSVKDIKMIIKYMEDSLIK